ncbi:MAG: hypothetical protein ACYTF7_06060 [Planctomycetota bacterium]|jgi:hypothetical protein
MTAAQLCAVDQTLLERFGNQEITKYEWSHAMHIRIGWIHVRRYGFEEALGRMRELIPSLNDAHGVPNNDDEGYHETLTRLWLTFIEMADGGDCREASSSEEFVRNHPELLDKKRPLRFYTSGHLMSLAARRDWAEPDVEALGLPV